MSSTSNLSPDSIVSLTRPVVVVMSSRLSDRGEMDLHEDAKNNTVTATIELPGLNKENVQIDVQNGRLSVSGEIKLSSEHEESGYFVRERRYGKFSKILQLPRGVKEDQIKASLEDGVLTLTFPKSTPEEAPKKVTIS